MSVIDIEDAAIFVGGQAVINCAGLKVQQGECHALIGADNEGKTSLLNAIVGIHPLSSGRITLFDEYTPSMRHKYMRRLGYVPDDLLDTPVNAARFLDLTIGLRRIPDWIDYAQDLIDYFHIDPMMPMSDMTDDMNKCVYIVSAILSEPELLILDEPFNFLNSQSASLLKEWLKAYVEDGNTVLITSDNYSAVSPVCDTLSVMKDRQTIHSNVPVSMLQSYKLVTASDVNVRTLPENLQIVEQTLHTCKMIYRRDAKDIEGFKQALMQLECRNFTVEDITIDDELYHTYEWLEEFN